MEFSQRLTLVWLLTPDEDQALQDALRAYLDMPQEADGQATRRYLLVHQVLAGRTGPSVSTVAVPVPLPFLTGLTVGPIVQIPEQAGQHPEFASICARPECFLNTPHVHGDGTGIAAPAPSAPPSLTPEQRARLQEQSDALKRWQPAGLATHEGSEK